MYDYLDINSFVDYLIITEFTKNIDGYCLSTFLYNKNITQEIPKFHIGPIWDYNFSLGLTDYHGGFDPEGFIYDSNKYTPFWWRVLLEDDHFSERLEDRYFELRKTALSNNNINQTIDSLVAICNNATDLNFKKWTVLNSEDFWPNYFLGKTYYEEIEYLKSWIKQRLLFLDEKLLDRGIKGERYYEIAIRNDEAWLKDIQSKALERNVSIEEMVIIDAKYMANKE
jgi:spore coat protein CotH